MRLKVKLRNEYSECAAFKKIVESGGLKVKGLFKYDHKLKIVSGTNSELRRQIYICTDVAEIIIDREKAEPVNG